MQPANIAPRDRLIVALDLPGVEQAEAMVARLGDSVTFYKIGYQLAYAGGLPLVRKLADQGKKVFLDLKLHDIGNTVARGVESVAKLGATFLTVHAYPQTMKAAVEARAGSNLQILAVTVLTSYDDGDLHAAGYRLGVSDLVEARAQQAQVLGVDGIVCSPEEAASLAQARRSPDAAGDARHPSRRCRERRPEAHHDAGARDRGRRDYLVVGRPVIGSGRSQGGGGSHSGRDRADAGWRKGKGTARMAKGYWIARVDVHSEEGYKPYALANPRDLQEIRRALCGPRRQVREPGRREPHAQRGDRISGLCGRARLLRSPEYQANIKRAAAAFDRRPRHHRRL